MTINTTPYANLDPSLIWHAIESVGFQCNGSLLALNSYENRVYQIGVEEGKPLIAKFYRPNRWSDAAILEEHQFSEELVEHEIPVIAPLKSERGETLHHYEGYRFALFPRQGGRALELDNLEQLEWMGRFIGRIHAVGVCRPFTHRPELNVQTHGHKPYQYLLEHHFIPDNLKDRYCQVVDDVLKKVAQCFQMVGSVPMIRVHGDFHASNVLWNDSGPWIVDLDDCLKAPAVQDLWMLLSGTAEQSSVQLEYILRGYREFYDFNVRELYLIEALRSLRMIQYSGWLATRWEDPTFPINFPWFNTVAYWHEQILNLEDQGRLLEEVLA